MKSDVVVIIPARFSSTRLPGKPLISLAGRPLILHVLDRAKEIKSVEKVIVATDDERIVDVVAAAGEEVVMTPENLPSGSDRAGWVVRDVECKIVVNLQGDEPLIDTEAVEKAIQLLLNSKDIMAATLGFPLQNEVMWKDFNVVKVITDENLNALYFSRQPIPHYRNGKFKQNPRLFQHLGVYIYRKQFLLDYLKWEPSVLEQAEKLEQLRILDKGFSIRVIETTRPSFGVDTLDDAIRIEKLLNKKG